MFSKSDTQTDAQTEDKSGDREIENNIFHMTCFRPNYNKTTQILRKNWDTLSRSNTTKHLDETKLLFCYKRPKNITDLLIRAKQNYHPERNQTKVTSKNICKHERCKICQKIKRDRFKPFNGTRRAMKVRTTYAAKILI